MEGYLILIIRKIAVTTRSVAWESDAKNPIKAFFCIFYSNSQIRTFLAGENDCALWGNPFLILSAMGEPYCKVTMLLLEELPCIGGNPACKLNTVIVYFDGPLV